MKLLNLASKFTGMKIGKKIDKETKEKLLKNIAKDIAKIDSKRTEEDIYKILNKGETRILIPTYSRFSICPYGVYNPISNEMYLQEDMIDYFKENLTVPGTIIHESIHKIQKIPPIFRGKEIKGFMEGITEYYEYKSKLESNPEGKEQGFLLTKGEHQETEIRFNFPPSSYAEVMSLMAQLEVVLGKEKMESFALYGNTKMLIEIQKEYGKDFYEQLRKGTNKLIKDDDTGESILKECQDSILNVCYEKKFSEIENIDDSISFLQELKELDKVRGHIKGDTSFKDFYNQKYKSLKERFKEFSGELEPLEYTEPILNKLQNWDEIKEDLKNAILHHSYMYRGSNPLENIKDFKKMQRFAMLKDGVLHHVILKENELDSYNIVSEDIYREYVHWKKENGRYFIIRNGKRTEEFLTIDENGVSITKGDSTESMRRISIDILPEELEQYSEERTKEMEELNPKPLIQRIKERISGRKTLRLDSGENDNVREESANEFRREYKCIVDSNLQRTQESNTEEKNKPIEIDEILPEI